MASDPSATPQPIAEIEQGPSKFEQFLDANQRKLIALAVVLTLGLLGFVAYRTIERDNRHDAGAALTKAPDLTALLDVVKNHAGTPAAGSAQVLTADAQWADGRQDDAINTLREFLVTNPKHPARPTAIASLGSRLMAQGKNGEAKEKFTLLLDDPDASYLVPFALISLGDIAASEGNLDEAEALLIRARDEYPDQNYASVAKRHLALLRAQSPVEIDPPPPPVVPEPGEGTPAIPGMPAPGIPGIPTPGGIPGIPTPPSPGTTGTTIPTAPATPATVTPIPATPATPAAPATPEPAAPATPEPAAPEKPEKPAKAEAAETPAEEKPGSGE